jgi:hypothetical protein
MAGLAHFGVGFAAKRIAPKVPVWILVAGGAVIDLIWGALALVGPLLGVGSDALFPLSHGLFMSVVWSLFTIAIAVLIMREWRTGLVLGAIVFSHWVLDFISHPMGFGKILPPDLPLFFASSPKVGLGLYQDIIAAYVFDIGVFLLGLGIYVFGHIGDRSKKNTPS